MNELGGFLATRGYLRFPLTRSGVGHFHTPGTLNGRPVEVLVDTGAACTCVAMSVAQALGLRTEWVDQGAGGAGGPLDQYLIHGADFLLGVLRPRLAGPVGLDFEQVNAPLRAQGSAEVDVILGVDVFDAHAAIIDYESQSLFLKALTDEPRSA